MNFVQRLKSDVTYVRGLLRILNSTSDITPDSSNLLPDDWERLADTYSENVAIIFEGQSLTYRDVELRANVFANWAKSQGIQKGDCVALLMGNRPDFIAIWLGIVKLGARCALINNQLAATPLAHCLNIVDAKLLIMGDARWDQYVSAKPHMNEDTPAWVLGKGAPEGRNLEDALVQVSNARPDKTPRSELVAKDVALYIFTSGTTGLPKAARMTHARCQTMMRSIMPACKSVPEDRVMVSLPLYHATGGLVAVGCAFMAGAAVVIERKFSPSTFWETAIETGATNFVYIGEMGRFLMNCAPKPQERQHKITRCFGNGLRADVWRELVARTGISRIYEFYGATEGNVNLLNLDGKVGAIGRIPALVRHRLPTRLIRVDSQSGDVLRDEDGFCIETKPEEVGEAIGKINPNDNRGRFEGYRDKSKNKNKILTNVFEKGDAYFRTGDLMRRDKDQYFFFVDRLGDTYRWKAENVSTNEVSEVLSAFDGVKLANVYGVEVQGHEGRAGMAAIQIEEGLDFAALWAHVKTQLPEFARPVFLRLLDSGRTTESFKFKKVELVEEGFNPEKVDTELYISSKELETFEVLTPQIYADVLSGKRRV
ncbi:long-chain-acyl-CoA synthetase [Hirschia litorea]|uniref:Long-chain-acyl-CoA synthetase n=1 Tax=Hirschia litorea TaxID=1199156 RepID=A0ABW2IMQ2_9PROT